MSYAKVIVASLKTVPDAQLHLGDDVLVEMFWVVFTDLSSESIPEQVS